MATYESERPDRQPRRRRRSAYGRRPRWLYARRIVASIGVLAVVLVGAYGVRLVLSVANLFHTDPITAVRAIVGGHGDSSVAQAQRDLKRVTIALYGYGGVGHDGAYLSDSIMIVTIQPQANGPARVAQISIPRDWYVPIDLGGGTSEMGRINEAYASGNPNGPFTSKVYTDQHAGGEIANATIERMLGIHIDYFIGIDFTAFKDAVDSVGGIDVTVQRTFTDHNYPRGECPPDCAVTTIHFDAGRQHMDGARALIFARSRESSDPQEGSNFARNKRQQLVLAAVKQRVLSVGGLKNLPDLVNALGDHINFNIPIGDALSLYDVIKDVDTTTITHISIDSTNLIYECDYPRSCNAALEFPYDRTFATAHHYIDSVFVPTDTLGEHAPVKIVDGSGRPVGASMRWTSMLSQLGFAAADGGQALHITPHTRVIDQSGGRDAKTAEWLARYYGVTVETGTATAITGSQTSTSTSLFPPSPSAAGGDGVLVVIGTDTERSFSPQAAGLYR